MKTTKRKRSTSLFADIIYWLLIGITAANYSFITFTRGGDEILSGALKPLAYLRLPLAIIGYLFLVAVHKKRFRLGNVDAAIYLLLFAILFAIPMSFDAKTAAIYGFWFSFQLLFIAKYAYYLSDSLTLRETKLKLILPLLFYGAYFLVLTILSLPEYNIGRPFPAAYTTRVQVSMLAPLFLGGLACCYSDIRRKSWYYWPMLAMVLFCIAVLLVSGKRASIVCVFLIAGAFFVFKTKASGKLIAALFLPGILAVVFYTGFSEVAMEASEYSLQRIEKGFNTKTATSINARLYIWDVIGEYANTHPLGVGLNVGRQIVGGGLHNTYLGYLLEVGWLSFVIFISILVWSIYKSVFSKIPERKDVFYFIFLPCLLYSLTEYNTSPGQPLFIPFWVAILFALLPVKRRKVSQP